MAAPVTEQVTLGRELLEGSYIIWLGWNFNHFILLRCSQKSLFIFTPNARRPSLFFSMLTHARQKCCAGLCRISLALTLFYVTKSPPTSCCLGARSLFCLAPVRLLNCFFFSSVIFIFWSSPILTFLAEVRDTTTRP